MTEAGKLREIELLKLYAAEQNRLNPGVDEVVSHFLEDPNISKDMRDSVKTALGVAKLEGFILGMKHDDGQEVKVDGEPFQVLLSRGRMVETIIEAASKSNRIRNWGVGLPERPAETNGGHEIRP